MSDVTDPKAWADKAEDDFTAAQLLLRRKEPLTYIVCYHAQQCAEKYFKALLIANGHQFPRSHDLVMLNDLCAQAGIFVEIDRTRLALLTDHAIRTRYPGDDPTTEEARSALETSKAVRRFSRKYLGLTK